MIIHSFAGTLFDFDYPSIILYAYIIALTFMSVKDYLKNLL